MPRTEGANQRLREAQRAKILDAARTVFARKGMAATMDDFAAAAAVSHGLAYRYFASKEALLSALVEQVLQSSSTLISHILEMAGTPGQRLDVLLTRSVEPRREHPAFYQLLYQALTDETMPNDLREWVRRRGQLFQDVLRQLIVEGQATGEVAEDPPDQLLTAVMACFEGLWRGMASRDPEQVKRDFPEARIVLRMLRPSPDQARRPASSSDEG